MKITHRPPTPADIDSWFAELDRFAEVPFMEEGAGSRRCRSSGLCHREPVRIRACEKPRPGRLHGRGLTERSDADETTISDEAAVWSVTQAKARFSEVVDRAREQGPQAITKNGRPAVVVVSIEEWIVGVSLAEIRLGIERLAQGSAAPGWTRGYERSCRSAANVASCR